MERTLIVGRKYQLAWGVAEFVGYAKNGYKIFKPIEDCEPYFKYDGNSDPLCKDGYFGFSSRYNEARAKLI